MRRPARNWAQQTARAPAAHPDFIDIVRRILFHEKGDRVAHHDGQRYGPQVERDLLAFAQLPVYAGREVT